MHMQMPALAAALSISLAQPAVAQEWREYVNTRDGFRVDFPGEPQITETTWTTEFGYTLPARVYSATRGLERYTMTAVDYNGIEQQGWERSKKCAPGAETCQGQTGGVLFRVIGPSYATQDIRGALLWASLKFIQRDAKVTAFHWSFTDLVEGYQLHLTNRDESRTFVSIYMHENRLYVMEGTAPKGYPEPGLFQQSLGFVDKDGNVLRYEAVYSNEFHGLRIYDPPPVRRGGGAGAAPGGQGAR
jgi:hypothetical protein